ncbi:Holo-[acyl-carrier-protein] synthase [Polystyrenella longa]|uniref:Holo-[acyl-carrier-protein] synthase n=1 Tax=Polystyrenella longa TaxID=2528007 RepID=A0A518CMW7_9PLAN|nr:holo-ACP synthase [Polystyrenella longa]QDU80553.1 Holo-[acyl-carrier-protein] synthase [Polystyrenella longa]
MIVGLGTDIVEINRIEKMITRHGDHFLERVFTSGEQSYCKQKKMAVESYAGRWAAKEAVMKTLGTGFIKGVHFTEIEIENLNSGQPIVRLLGSTADLAEKMEISTILITISHSKEYATATAIALKAI